MKHALFKKMLAPISLLLFLTSFFTTVLYMFSVYTESMNFNISIDLAGQVAYTWLLSFFVGQFVYNPIWVLQTSLRALSRAQKELG